MKELDLTLDTSLEVDDKLNTYWADGKLNEDVFCIGDASAVVSGKLPATAQGTISSS